MEDSGLGQELDLVVAEVEGTGELDGERCDPLRVAGRPGVLALQRLDHGDDDVLRRVELVAQSLDLDHRADAGDQLVQVDRLVEEVVRAQLVGPDLVLDAGQGGEHHDRDEVGVAPTLEGLADAEAVDPRHHDVEDDAVGRLGVDLLEGCLAVRGQTDREALLGEHVLEQDEVLRLVVDGQDPAAEVERGSGVGHLPSLLVRLRSDT